MKSRKINTVTIDIAEEVIKSRQVPWMPSASEQGTKDSFADRKDAGAPDNNQSRNCAVNGAG